MKNQPLRVAFVGVKEPSLTQTLAFFSPLVQPLACRDWNDLGTRLPTFSPELIVILPASKPRPPFQLSVPVIPLQENDLALSPELLEARILQDPGTRVDSEPLSRLIGVSSAVNRVRASVENIARTHLPILLLGESGTGKDLVATLAHEVSQQSEKPFVAVNCAAIPTHLAESELFGSVRGALTGAENRDGLCQHAQSGTLFLDEIGELPLEVQCKLLRTLENHEVRRVGSSRLEAVKFRLICATNRNLKEEIRKGRFREDLYYRISVMPIQIPALRERKEDIPLLALHFLQTEFPDHGSKFVLKRSALDKLKTCDWPGNLRQLKNAVLRAAVFHRTFTLTDDHFDLES